MITQLISGYFEDEYHPTTKRTHVVQINSVDTTIRMVLYDTSGGEKNASAREATYHSAEGFLAIYDISSRKSFDELKAFVAKIQKKRKTNNIPMVVVGNKLDLEEARKVDKEEGEAQAKIWGCPFMEITTKDRYSVLQAFLQVVTVIDQSEECGRQRTLYVNSTTEMSNNKCCPNCVIL